MQVSEPSLCVQIMFSRQLRARVNNLQRVLETFGEEDDMDLAIQEALSARERPVSERIQTTRLYVERKQKRVEPAREVTARAREA